jgi:hypothetical protein
MKKNQRLWNVDSRAIGQGMIAVSATKISMTGGKMIAQMRKRGAHLVDPMIQD